MAAPTLSICISTRNRAQFLGETLDSIVGQLDSSVELVVLDGASTDGTPDLMRDYVTRYPAIRYCREKQNSGVDQDYDKVVGYARGKYCWLMTDDDVLCADAVRHVVLALGDADLVIVNAEVRNRDFSELLQERLLPFVEDRRYDARNREEFFRNCAHYMTFIGAIVIKRDAWLSRDRQTYYGTEFIHLGVIFQRPNLESIQVVCSPLITIRYGNASWGPRTFEVWGVKFPRLVWSLPDLSDEAKASATDRWPWRDMRTLFYWRAVGAYSKPSFDRFVSGEARGLLEFAALCISLIPGSLASASATLYLAAFNRSDGLRIYDLLNGRYSGRTTRYLARVLGLSRLIQA